MKIFSYINLFIFSLIIFSCEKTADNKMAASNATGTGGSLAKFTILGNYVYAVSMHYLYTIDISDPAHPRQIGSNLFSFDMETIYPYRNRLFIGSKTGLYIYSIDDPSKPVKIGEAKHGRSCDPVVANDSVSYSTLKGNSYCGPATSGLYVYDVKNLNTPALKTTIPLNDPIGLGMADSALYVCAQDGLKIFNIKNAYSPAIRQTITGASYTDVIPYGDVLICWVGNTIALYDIADRLNPTFIKQIAD
jgi:hypothetical protein